MQTRRPEIEREMKSLPTLRETVAIVSRWRWAAIAVFVLIIAAVVLSGVWIPTYETEMKIIVSRKRSDVLVTSSANAPVQINGDQVSEEDLNSEVELINSGDLLRSVVLATGLAGSRGTAPTEASIAAAVRGLHKDLKIEAVRKTNVIALHYESRDPKMAANVLRMLASAYIEKHLEVHRPAGEFKFFDQQAEQYQQKLDEAQKKLTDFTNTSGVVSADVEKSAALQRADEFDSMANQASSAIAEAEQRIRELTSQQQTVQTRMTTSIRTSVNVQLLQQLKSTLLTLQLKRSELLSKYDPAYRPVQEVEQQIADAKDAISAEESRPLREQTTDENPTHRWIESELSKSQADLSGLKARRASAKSIAAQYRKAARQLDVDGVIQQDLLRQAKTQEENYLLYTRKREEARISDALDQRGILNVAIAEQPIDPALPKGSSLSIILLALFLATVVSLGTVFTIDFFNPTLGTADVAADFMGDPVLASVRDN